MNKALLTRAFEAMGVRRVTRGLQAKGHDWGSCFLALAYRDCNLTRVEYPEAYIAYKARVHTDVINSVRSAYDNRVGAFRELAAEWLELNRKESTSRVPKIPRRAVGVRTDQRKGIKVSAI